MRIREAEAADWAAIWPIWKGIVDDGETYAYPDTATSEQAREWWLEGPPSRVVVAVDDDTSVLGTAKMGPAIFSPKYTDRPAWTRERN